MPAHGRLDFLPPSSRVGNPLVMQPLRILRPCALQSTSTAEFLNSLSPRLLKVNWESVPRHGIVVSEERAGLSSLSRLGLV
jgi:hypothetical protein